ncbi:DNA repair protein rad16 [Vanrija albida]|uniref:DNA repair protein rad16 n=1 Tax=Vanrija albida TaxID=181172 RepID=A0ABR3Q144_9TREE
MSTPSTRRSTRASKPPLPTPASTKRSSSSAATTPGSSAAPSINTGAITPMSMSDTEEDSPVPPSKRKASPLAPSAKRQALEVAIPTGRGRGRSKLGVEKTDSADNLTLESSAVKTEPEAGKRSTRARNKIVDIQSESEEDVKPVRSRAKGKGKATAKKLESDSDLDLSPSSEEDIKLASTRAKGKGRAAVRKIDSDDDFDVFANDTDEEEEQLGKALSASRTQSRVGASSSATPTTSRPSSAKPRGRKASAGQTLGGKAHKSDAPARARMAKAAERLVKRANGASASASPSGPSTAQSPESTFNPSDVDDSGSDLSSISLSDDDDMSDSDGGSSPAKKRSTKATKAARESAKMSRAEKKKIEREIQNMPDHWTQEEREAEIERTAREKVLVRKGESKLKKKLGRSKLTQGEKNQVRLALVSRSLDSCPDVQYHPELKDCWGDLESNIEPVKPVPMEAHPSLKLTLLPFQKESLYWMKKQEEGVWRGGMLADEMGMGKTIQTIALLLSEPRRKPSLVVAPVVALMQWKHEIETHAEGFTTCLYHGSHRVKAAELKKYDVVLTSYGTLEAAFRRQQLGFKRQNLMIKEKSALHSFQWFRVILDEAHNIKERSTNAAKAAFALDAEYRWCLSGTPLQNRVGELYSLVRFLGADPFSFYFCKKCDCKSLHWKFSNKRHCDDCGHTPMAHVSLWNSEILTPIARYGIEEGGPGKTAFKKLKILLDRMMLRRTKLERADDLGLPPRTIVVRRDFFSPQEKELYMSLFTNAKRQFDTYLDAGTVLNNYSNIFSLITRMRQMACHPDLVLRAKKSALAVDVTEGTVCRICNDTAEDAIMSSCKHVFDRECIRQYLEVTQLRGHRPECPVCHIEISIDLEQEAMDLGEEGNKRANQGILSRLNVDNWRSSCKLEALVEELEKLRRKDCTTKSLVFSQFVSFLDLIAFRLQRAGFNICRLEGGMSPQQRDATIQHFMKNTQVTVFLISLKAGGVALNLTEASMVFMMDSWWNPSVEYQAMDRIHRLGQKRPVKVVKLVVEDSIEDQIVQLQQKKLAMTDAALSRDPDAALGKLTVEDLGFLFKL